MPEPPNEAQPRRLTATAPDEAAGQRLDRVLAALFPELSRSRIQRLIADGLAEVDGAPAAKASLPVEPNQRLAIEVPADAAPAAPIPQAMDLEIVHEDDDLVVVNKPAGLVVHSGAGEHATTLVNGLLYLYNDSLSREGGAERRGIVHRLDMGTSGVMAVARHDTAHRSLSLQFKARTVEKQYTAVVYGCPRETRGVVDIPLGRDRADRTRISGNTDRPREAATEWRVAEELAGFALLEVLPKTGRMHQVRAHLTAINHPCVGDLKYAGTRWKGVAGGRIRGVVRRFGRPALHAARLQLDHPGDGKRMEFVAPLPLDLEELLATLRRDRDQAGGL